jgi:hypothetical protein
MNMQPINKLKIGLALCLSASLLLLASCVADDLSVCGVNVQFRYLQYTKGDVSDPGTDMYASAIKNIHLYVFNTDSVLVAEQLIDQNPMPTSTYISNLQPGDYHFVAWGNVDDQYYRLTTEPVIGTTKMGDLEMAYQDTNPDSVVSYSASKLYYGKIDANITPSSLQDQNVLPVINLIRDTKDITVSAEGLALGTKAAGTMYDCHIASTNGSLKFDNSIAADERFRYMPSSEVDTTVLVSKFSLVRETTLGNSLPTLTFTRTLNDVANTIYNENITSMLVAAATQQSYTNFDHKESFNILLVFNETYGTVSVYIDGWEMGEGHFSI